jgi:hypothetical protein
MRLTSNTLSMFALALASACGGGDKTSAPGSAGAAGARPGGNAEGGAGNGAPASAGSSGEAAQPVLFDGFDFALQEGDFWEYGWTTDSSSYAQGSDGSSSTSTGTLRITLGPPSSIGDVTAYAIEYSGSGFVPRWTHLAVSDNRLLVSNDGETFAVLFDARGTWPGSGFFATFSADILYTATEGTLTNEYYDGPALVVQQSNESGQCEYFSDVGTICGSDTQESFDEREFYLEGVGPVGYSYSSSYSSCGGGFCSGSSTSHELGLVASSLRGDSVDYDLEVEPNDAPSEAQALSLPVHATATGTLDDENATEVIVTSTLEEQEPNDSSLAPQLLTAPAVVEATMASEDAAATLLFPYDGVDYQAMVQDWYTFDVALDTNILVTLDHAIADDKNIGLLLFASEGVVPVDADGTTLTGDTPLALDTTTTTPKLLSGPLVAGSYLLAVTGVALPASAAADYTLSVTSDLEGPIRAVEDWYTITVDTETTLTLVLDYDGDPGSYPNNIDLFLFGADGSTLLAASASPAGQQDSITREAPAGTYYVGVDIVLSPGATGGSENYVLTFE